MAEKHTPEPLPHESATPQETDLDYGKGSKTEVQPKLTDNQHHVTQKDVDDTTVFYSREKDNVGILTPELKRKINRKNFWCLLSQTWWIAFLIHLDKSTLSQASTMGIFDDIAMTKSEYNNLFVVFYVGYLVALWPGGVVAQRVGHKYFITVSLILWALLLGLHLVVKNGKQMMALRFFLGMVRGQLNSDLKLSRLLI